MLSCYNFFSFLSENPDCIIFIELLCIMKLSLFQDFSVPGDLQFLTLQSFWKKYFGYFIFIYVICLTFQL